MTNKIFYKNKGFTLIEVLVAVVILSIGLLGIAALQTTSVKNVQTANFRGQATLLTDNLIDRMRANRTGTINGDYIENSFPISPSAPSCDETLACTTTQLAKDDLTKWYANLERSIGNSETVSAKITCDGVVGAGACAVGSIITITISWQERVDKKEDDLDRDGTGINNDGLTVKRYSTGFQL